ncbi:LysM peptidoglycan-binding domain-containing protein [Nakamurella sp. GG22]
MRTQLMTSRLEDRDWVALPVDPTGWLAGAAPGGIRRAAIDGAAGAAEHRPTEAVTESGRRARERRVRRGGAAERLARRQADRRRRGIPARALSRVVVPLEVQQPAPATATAEEGYRVDRWARLALTVTVLAAAVVVSVALASSAAAPRMVDVTVAPGDTLWSIAGEAAPDRDPRAVIEEIKALNDVTGGVLPVGVVLRVPSSTE